jgi:hypothetical protein
MRVIVFVVADSAIQPWMTGVAHWAFAGAMGIISVLDPANTGPTTFCQTVIVQPIPASR